MQVREVEADDASRIIDLGRPGPRVTAGRPDKGHLGSATIDPRQLHGMVKQRSKLKPGAPPLDIAA